MRIQITLRSGAQIEAQVDEFTITKSRIHEQIQELHWVSPEGSMRRLKHIVLSEIAAIIAIHEADDSAEPTSVSPGIPAPLPASNTGEGQISDMTRSIHPL